jgi:hypothetical protein
VPPLFRPDRLTRRNSAFWGLVFVAAALFSVTLPSRAQTTPAAANRVPPAPTEGVTWSALSPSQKLALRPLEAEWGRIDNPRRSKWLEIADRFPKMSPAEQARVQNRMAEWAKLTPRERGQARMNFREAQQVPAQERKAKWEEYKALPPEQRKQLAAKAVPPARKPANDSTVGSSALKSNVVPNPSYAPKPKPVAPTVAQAQPGATTNLITKRPNPPAHQPAGLPKIAVTPGFVDQSTLLPKRGPQGAATRSAAAPASAPPRQ